MASKNKKARRAGQRTGKFPAFLRKNRKGNNRRRVPKGFKAQWYLLNGNVGPANGKTNTLTLLSVDDTAVGCCLEDWIDNIASQSVLAEISTDLKIRSVGLHGTIVTQSTTSGTGALTGQVINPTPYVSAWLLTYDRTSNGSAAAFNTTENTYAGTYQDDAVVNNLAPSIAVNSQVLLSVSRLKSFRLIPKAQSEASYSGLESDLLRKEYRWDLILRPKAKWVKSFHSDQVSGSVGRYFNEMALLFRWPAAPTVTNVCTLNMNISARTRIIYGELSEKRTLDTLLS